jgi:hypothetical protein
VRKEKYLQCIRDAGFSGVSVIKDQSFPVDCMLNDETARVLLDDPSFPAEGRSALSALVRSITLTAEKRR